MKDLQKLVAGISARERSHAERKRRQISFLPKAAGRSSIRLTLERLTFGSLVYWVSAESLQPSGRIFRHCGARTWRGETATKKSKRPRFNEFRSEAINAWFAQAKETYGLSSQEDLCDEVLGHAKSAELAPRTKQELGRATSREREKIKVVDD